MTKERKLAIDMWLWIRERYDEWDDYFWGASDEDGLAKVMKDRFIEEEYEGTMPKWRYTCWLCTYIRDRACSRKTTPCARCPLGTCQAPASVYQVLNTHCYRGEPYVSEKVYRDCCTKILNALGYKGE